MSSLPKPPVWLITGCSSGFGLNLALLALRNGHKVIASSRNISKTPKEVSQIEKLGGAWIELDVCSPNATTILDKATAIHGRIDILVNNAAYALLGAFETFSDAECRAEMETNFFAPLNLCRHVIPRMRTRRSGLIINMSSTAGIEAKPSRTMYSASKFALEAFSEALYHEMKPFGVRVLLVEPGAFRSSFAENMTVGAVHQLRSGSSPGDLEKGCQAIFDVALKTGQAEGMEEFLRLPLGKDGSERWKVKLKDLRKTLDATEFIWSKTDHDDIAGQ
ncbi:Oxidoreductase claN [Hyphodiscus hymeniophilus]|uniref:Oxidoreductase claN n=1 Tax=Hyphodiscus hymeniophilus TaxID=353542 RepID=A0A9P6SKT4_9HELO|nr:Oxidoreductase claN [Hyphodiscus hymeniophilus]